MVGYHALSSKEDLFLFCGANILKHFTSLHDSEPSATSVYVYVKSTGFSWKQGLGF